MFLAARRKLNILLLPYPRVFYTSRSFLIRHSRETHRQFDFELHSPLILHLQLFVPEDPGEFFTRNAGRLVEIDYPFPPSQFRPRFDVEEVYVSWVAANTRVLIAF